MARDSTTPRSPAESKSRITKPTRRPAGTPAAAQGLNLRALAMSNNALQTSITTSTPPKRSPTIRINPRALTGPQSKISTNDSPASHSRPTTPPIQIPSHTDPTSIFDPMTSPQRRNAMHHYHLHPEELPDRETWLDAHQAPKEIRVIFDEGVFFRSGASRGNAVEEVGPLDVGDGKGDVRSEGYGLEGGWRGQEVQMGSVEGREASVVFVGEKRDSSVVFLGERRATARSDWSMDSAD